MHTADTMPNGLNAPARPQPDEAQTPPARDLRGAVTTARDQSAHRRYAWLYDDLLA
jgi:hypothetical protein